ncbi:asparagine synthase (glutamine-hydrolyzing) [Nitrospirillum sp. BR 11164]|uniref:asparagine synthase (glutamine-hydrolyzing) n=1 Tax=Nitrospirillum sp. BR 11164 TaxID=3104324 RepID=UPI002AFEAEEF|nr:asparagine synthase (glutamine-hydrolyzing) [Nitrospirillum sp. BR 11164]MEA1647488.1 asparagine synthase (glutamine-hydrolyzing) [Nitrospirillum sp. BR 11164]
MRHRGALGIRGADGTRLARQAGVMIDRLAHRGPDDRGVWQDDAAGVALANRRLAIIDLSPLGHQPMTSADGRVTVAFNGEIYNYQDLRRQLAGEGVVFRGQSDTEVLVEAIARWGADRALAACNGMFGLAIWLADERRLMLVRDRLGEKPLYWSLSNGVLLFASELKAVRAQLGYHAVLDEAALADYFRHGFIPAPRTAFTGIRQLPPGTCMTVSADGGAETRAYWSVADAARRALAAPLTLEDPEILRLTGDLLTDAVRRRMVSDVPLGVFLSGGIDSALVAALMQEQSAAPIRSFTIGFDQAEFDESAAAEATAKALGTDHTTLRVDAADAVDLVPHLAGMYDEPFADISAIPTALLCRLARRHVTVALSGDGGDEAFGGYSRHLWAGSVSRWRRRPAWLRHGLARLDSAMPDAWIDGAAHLLRPHLRQPADKVGKFLGAVAAADEDQAYIAMLGMRADAILRPGLALEAATPVALPKGADPALRLQLRDLARYLPDGVLVKVDRASMAASLEARAPLLDPRVVEWGLRLPLHQRLRDGRGKWMLRRLLADRIPQGVATAPKTGFGAPLGAWLRGPLRDWAAGLLDGAAGDTLIQAPVAAALWRQHLSGGHDHAGRLWTVLSYLSWKATAAQAD